MDQPGRSRPLTAYQGDEPYVFVSYAHEDQDVVFPEIQWLNDQGFNVWFDKGISPGARWSDELARSLQESTLFLYFGTPNSVDSRHCQDEINLALDGDKPTITVYLQETELTPGLKLRLSSHQAIFKHELSDQEYRDKLITGISSHVQHEPGEYVANHPASNATVNTRSIIVKFGLLSAAVLAVGLLMFLQWGSDSTSITESVSDKQTVNKAKTGKGPADSEGAIRGISVAVLPFNNLSEDANKGYFSDGLVEDISTELSRFTELQVIPSRVTYPYRGTTDVLAAATELGATYVIVGSVRLSEAAVRINAQLIEVTTGRQYWTETYDREMTIANLFQIQTDVATRVAGTLADSTGVLNRVGSDKNRAVPTDELAAYDCVLRGYAYFALHDDESHLIARECLERAVELDPGYADVWALLAYMYREEFHHKRNLEAEPLKRASQTALHAIDLDPTNATARYAMALTQFSLGNFPAGMAQADRALELNPNDATLMAALAVYITHGGELDRGVELARRAQALNPLTPDWVHMVRAAAHYQKGEYRECLDAVSRWTQGRDAQWYFHKAAALGQLDQRQEAAVVLAELNRIDPSFAGDPIGELRRYLGREELVLLYLEGLEKAGLEVSARTTSE